MPYRAIKVERDPPLGWIRLDRPDRLNAVDRVMARELCAAVRALNRSKTVRVLLLRGAGRAFSSGGDLREIGDRFLDRREKRFLPRLVDEVHAAVRAVWESPKPVIAAIHGAAAGAGLGLALACDLRLAAVETRFQMSFINIGLVADSGSTWLLPRLVGAGKAMELALTGEAVGVAEMNRLGVVNQIYPEAELFERAAELGRKLARKSPPALIRTKRLMQRGWNSTLDRQLAAERAGILAVVRESDDFAAAIRAFIDRPPRARDNR
jgi:2-(1,2-epoxy-1,2-dihydrophenyl)acetyl-CoA isomerase